jgi:transposase
VPANIGPWIDKTILRVDILIISIIKADMHKQGKFKLERQGLGALPIIETLLTRIKLHARLSDALGGPRHADAILLLLKNVLVERNAIYAIREWARQFDPSLVQGGLIGDDAIARALDKVFELDRASFLSRLMVDVVRDFNIDLSELHQDTTSITVFGAYANQRARGIQLKHGHSKDHRPDLKQLVYELSVTRDGAIPVLFKSHDGNQTDDTLHWDNWQALRGIVGRADFLYVADSKLCVKKTLMKIDQAKGCFVTMVPKTRDETKEFSEQAASGRVRWEHVYTKRSTRKARRMDIFDVALGPYQLSEGFRVHWFRSSEKRLRDEQSREESVELALTHLKSLDEPGRKKPRTEAALQRRADKILARFKVSGWIRIEIALERMEEFKQKTRGPATEDTDYRKIIKWVPRLSAKRDLEGIAKSAAMDGIFPLATNTALKPAEVLDAYKYQPYLEKRHALLKSGLQVAPIFLKKNDRIEALMFVYFLAQFVAALIERELRGAMKNQDIPAIQILPEERPSKSPTAEQVFRVFEPRARHALHGAEGQLLETFSDPLTPIQKQVLDLLGIKPTTYT